MNGPKLTPEHVAAQVVGVQYHVFPGTTVTVCCLTLRNGYNTIGHSACVSPENFDAAVGEQIAYKNALNEIWQLEGYLLREWLSLPKTPGIQPVSEQIAPAIVPHGHTAYAAAPTQHPDWFDLHPAPEVKTESGWPFPPRTEQEQEAARERIRLEAGGGDYAGAGASGSWAEPASCATPDASTGDTCSASAPD